ncbi:aspartate racemase [Candidatus Bathyarchaeota archaeon]|nr:MAG: aspartate racemase [Candidatus Bathyarchaeota archaeon]
MEEKVIGILGGMGPEATAELFMRIIRATPVERDQDHLRVVIDSNPKIPDRTAAILGEGPSPLPEMRRTARNLEGAGADFIIIPCNTAHYFYEELKEGVRIPILNMIELTAARIRERLPEARRVGLIATTGTLRAGIYDRALEKHGVEVIHPSEEAQRRVMEAIYEKIKRGLIPEGREIILEVAARLVEEGADAIICGCTEVSLVLKEGDVPVPVIDPLQVLAEKAVAIALGREPIP